jgi:hypothetical protein
MYDTRPNLIIGFHGCDKYAAEALINDPNTIKISDEPHDWLGHGMYFWENNQERARQWAVERQLRKKQPVADAAVIGAVLQLGYCCDLTDSRFIGLLKEHYKAMEDFYSKSRTPLPVNRDLPTDPHKNKLLRVLDCTVIEFMHNYFAEQYAKDIKAQGFSDLKIFDSTRGVFTEGGPIYSGAEIFEKTHIQICIRNSNCIKGFFLPRKEIEFLPVAA